MKTECLQLKVRHSIILDPNEKSPRGKEKSVGANKKFNLFESEKMHLERLALNLIKLLGTYYGT